MSSVFDTVNANAITTTPTTATTTSSSSTTSTGGAGTENQFLTLLVAQLQNQDPTNPLDNSQLTSQIAQINTVNGIDQLNTTVGSLATQFMQLQVMQGTGLIGHDVTVPGNMMTMDAGTGTGGYSIPSDATDVSVKVFDAGGNVVDNLDLGKQSAGTQSFDWTPNKALDPTANYTFKVTAVNGTDSITSTALMSDKVTAVQAGGSTLTLQLQRSGSTPYSSVQLID